MLVTMAAAHCRFFHFHEVFATPATDLNLLRQTKQALGHHTIQNEMQAGIGLQDVGHWAALAQARRPRRRLAIALDQSARLGVGSPVKILVVKLAFLASRCPHYYFLTLILLRLG